MTSSSKSSLLFLTVAFYKCECPENYKTALNTNLTQAVKLIPPFEKNI